MDESTTKLVIRCRDRDIVAESELFNRYAERICRLAEKHIAACLKPRIDAEAIPNTVFRTFFRNARNGAFVIDNASDFWHLIVNITLKKVAGEAKFHCAQKRDPASETQVSEEDIAAIMLCEPDPEAVAIAKWSFPI